MPKEESEYDDQGLRLVCGSHKEVGKRIVNKAGIDAIPEGTRNGTN